MKELIDCVDAMVKKAAESEKSVAPLLDVLMDRVPPPPGSADDASASAADPRRDGRRGKRPGRLLFAKPTEPTDATGTRSEDVWDAKGDTAPAARNERALASIADECARVEVLARGRLMR